MKVWVVWDRDVNDGSEVIKVFDSEEKATKYAESYAQEVNAANAERNMPNRFVHQNDGNYYMQGCGWIVIDEKEVE